MTPPMWVDNQKKKKNTPFNKIIHVYLVCFVSDVANN